MMQFLVAFELTVLFIPGFNDFSFVSVPLPCVQDYNDEIRQEQMWEMQVLNTQRKPGALIGDILSGGGVGIDQHSTNSSAASSDSRNGSMSPASPPPPPGADLLVAHELLQHPALRGCLDQQRCQQNNNPGKYSNTLTTTT